MTIYYIKGDDDNYVEANADDIFKDRHDRWVKTESDKIRGDVEKSVREELEPSIRKEIEENIRGEYQPKLDAVESEKKKLDIALRQKTIAAEYGFKPGTEKYLGEGTDEDMRKEAENLNSNFITGTKTPEKQTVTGDDNSFIKLEKS